MSLKDEISDELVERMVAVVRHEATGAWSSAMVDEARAIAALLPKSVDPDIQIARDLIADSCADRGGDPDYIQYWREGCYDDEREFSVVLAALKRGKELSK